MRRELAAAAFMVMSSAALAAAADETWTGTIGDSKCGATHKAMQEHNKDLTDRACTEACVKSGGEYILSSNGKVYRLENQKDPSLAENAGRPVTVTGTMKGNTITATKITAR